MSPRIGAALGGLAGAMVCLWVGLSGWLSPGLSSLLGQLCWIVPGVIVAPFLGAPAYRPSKRDIVPAIAAAGLPMTLVAGCVLVLCVAGVGQWDPGGAGLVESWRGSEDGRMALRISAPHTLALLQACMVVAAPIWALPLGAGLAVWARALPSALRLSVVALVVGAWFALTVDPSMALSGGALAAMVMSLDGRSVWPAALGLAGLLGLPALGPLLAAGDVGLHSPWVWVIATIVAVLLVLVRRPT